MKRLVLISVGLLTLMGCSGMRTADGKFSTHAESIRILGYSIPADDQKRAAELVPASAKIESIDSTPADWTSLVGIIGNIFWPHQTRISGTVGETAKY